MKMIVTEPIGPYPEEVEVRQRYLEAACSPGTSVEFVPIEGATSVDEASSRDVVPAGFLRIAREARLVASYGMITWAVSMPI